MDTKAWVAIAAFCSVMAIAFFGLSRYGTAKAHANWEYQIVNVPVMGDDIRTDNGVELKNEDLNALGKTGWELVVGYEEIETTFPNLGDAKYVTGIQSNVRPKRAVLIFKRPLK